MNEKGGVHRWKHSNYFSISMVVSTSEQWYDLRGRSKIETIQSVIRLNEPGHSVSEETATAL